MCVSVCVEAEESAAAEKTAYGVDPIKERSILGKRKTIPRTEVPGVYIRGPSPPRPNPLEMAKMQAEGVIPLAEEEPTEHRPTHNGAGDPLDPDSSVHDSMN